MSRSVPVALPRAGRLIAAALAGVALTAGGTGAPAAMAMFPPVLWAQSSATSAPVRSAAVTPAPPAEVDRATPPASAPASDSPQGADTSATTPPTAPLAPPPAERAVTAAASDIAQVPEAPPVSTRPRFNISTIVGISVDNHGIANGRTVLVPSFAVQGGVGEGLVGFGLRLFASEAAGRFSSPNPDGSGKLVADLGADRQALDVLLNVRPFAPAWKDAGDAWTARFVRALAVELGVAVERVSIGTKSIFREGLVAGAHLSLPVVRSADGSELFVTVAARRMLAARQTVDIGGSPQSVGDSRLEAFSGLTVAF